MYNGLLLMAKAKQKYTLGFTKKLKLKRNMYKGLLLILKTEQKYTLGFTQNES